VSNRKNYFWSQCWRVTAPLLRSEARRPAVRLLALLVACALTVSGLNVVNSYIGRDFMTAAAAQEASRFTRLALLYAAMFGACAVVTAFYRFVEERLGLLWREWLTGHLIERYLGQRPHGLMSGWEEIDNPDQRIAEDVKAFTTTSLSFLLILLNSAITLCAFAGVLTSITPWLLVAAAGYAAFGSLMTVLLGRRLVGLNFTQLKQEADLRYELVRVREGRATAAALDGEHPGRSQVRGRLGDAISTSRRIIGVNRNVAFFTIGYDYLIQILPATIVVPFYFAGRVEFGVVTQSLVAFTHVVGAFSLIVKEYQRLSTFTAVVARIRTLWEALEASPPATVRPIPEADRGRWAFRLPRRLSESLWSALAGRDRYAAREVGV
jgi:putative ATP-binding cassette transporter